MGFFGIFNCIETFFFISLGITIILILLLIYHFKQQINTQERKSDTMFEIINSIVSEITTVKNQVLSIPSRIPFLGGMGVCQRNNEVCLQNDANNNIAQEQSIVNINLTEEEESDNDETDTEYETDDDDIIIEHRKIIVSDNEYEPLLDEEVVVEEVVQEVVSEELVVIQEVVSEELVVIQELVIQEVVVEEVVVEEVVVEEVVVEEVVVEEVVVEEVVVEEVVVEEVVVQELVVEELVIQEVVIQESNIDYESDDEPLPVIEDIKDLYKKKNTNELKLIAQTKGLHVTSKMKKDELLRLLGIL
jgi:hypothetical protein